jgi:hypothetical protein
LQAGLRLCARGGRIIDKTSSQTRTKGLQRKTPAAESIRSKTDCTAGLLATAFYRHCGCVSLGVQVMPDQSNRSVSARERPAANEDRTTAALAIDRAGSSGPRRRPRAPAAAPAWHRGDQRLGSPSSQVSGPPSRPSERRPLRATRGAGLAGPAAPSFFSFLFLLPFSLIVCLDGLLN